MQLGYPISKAIFCNLISYRLDSHFCIRIPAEFAVRRDELAVYKAIEHSEPSALQIDGLLGKLKHFDFKYEGKRHLFDDIDLESYLFRRQYLYRGAGGPIAPEPGDTVIDGGACLGDSALFFSNAVGDDGVVYSFDPMYEHLHVLEHNGAVRVSG